MLDKTCTFLSSTVSSSVSNILVSEILAAPRILGNFRKVSGSDSRSLFNANQVKEYLVYKKK